MTDERLIENRIWKLLAESIQGEKDETTIPVPVEDIRRLIDAREKAHTPTDDEREALEQAEASSPHCIPHALLDQGRCDLGEGCDGRCNEVAGETPGFISCPCGWSRIGFFHQLHDHQLTHESEPQGEPTDAQVDAAIRGFHEATFGTPDDGFLTPDRLALMRDPWRAALRAAGVGGEGR